MTARRLFQSIAGYAAVGQPTAGVCAKSAVTTSHEENDMRNASPLIVAFFAVLVGVHFLTPTKPRANEKPIIKYIAPATQAPVNHISTIFRQESPTSIRDLTSVFLNTSNEKVTAIRVYWTVHDESGGTMGASATVDALPFGDEPSLAPGSYLPGSRVEVKAEGEMNMRAPIRQIDVGLSFVETTGDRRPGIEWPAYGNVWPSRNESWLVLMQRRSGVAKFRTFLLKESHEKGLERIQEILQFEHDRIGRMIPQSRIE